MISLFYWAWNKTEITDFTNELFIGILTEGNKQHNLDQTQLLSG